MTSNSLRKPIQTALVPYRKRTQLPALTPGDLGNLDAYIKAANSAPVLTAEEERNLAIRMRDYNDVDAAQALIISHLRLVISVARGYLGYGLSHGDLIQEGNIGLMKAVRHYDPDKGVRLMTFAVHWIRAEIQEYIVRNSHMVKLATTHAQRKLFFNLRQMKKTDQALTNAQAEDIAEKLNVKPKEVLEMEKRLSGPDASLDTPLDEEGDSSVTAVDMLSDKSDEPVEILEKADELQLEQVGLKKAIEQLDPRSRRIIEARWFHENDEGEVKAVSLATLAKEFGISIERVRQLEKQAIAKLKKILTESSGK
ncbi:RNA polymerase sigma factor RpoH [Mesosutterella multiformis]|jgi:RNA polymerase sigma-32 factor|uniref:RNA polymerase sigma factor RpoH n=1 Tax=Mesosutterella multiformis TaxID=2259133 RepID=A0A388SCH8_9BURK|nr:RNA polymerase sigma factor RpoH [Mesosutterella multiformis]MBS5811495.1 RNA polymerase sigma factor RpoH [Sutterella sp.]MCH3935814.1 RNA polymerase sigma factor RpoH [Mesosutterella sp.]RGU80920.1 RNA polymerase sigma factor RpoH [Sutterella sp. AF15-45LB]RGU81588.1 RNA polymerase sigma factor RpoH [Sutterella sp. AF15-44LB]RHH08521.1 RNA polymerase sigma factor RpoH [Sutterella sp. AM18-8-1]